MKPTPIQQQILLRISNGVPREYLSQDFVPTGLDTHDVMSYQHSRDGVTIVAHRTIAHGNTGNPRLDYKVEMFRITREGEITRL